MIVLAFLLFLSAVPLLPQQPFAGRCAGCHGEEGQGSAQGPGLAMNPRVAAQSVEQLRAYLERGNPGAGMPSFADLPRGELDLLSKFLRRLNADTILPPLPDDFRQERARALRAIRHELAEEELRTYVLAPGVPLGDQLVSGNSRATVVAR